jgi:hypothetical protein
VLILFGLYKNLKKQKTNKHRFAWAEENTNFRQDNRKN